jgi:signal peptidase I
VTPDSPTPSPAADIDTESSPEIGPTGPSASPADRPRHRWLVELVVILVLVVAATLVLRVFVIQTFTIPSGSMLPTLQIGDRIIVDKLAYHVHRGSIVVFRRPPAENCGGAPVPDLVKRVIGLPGETISSRGNTVLIDGRPLAEPWFAAVPLGPAITTQTIAANHYFVMGDSRSDSCDSRYWGTVPASLIVGRAVAVIWPLSQVKGL